MSNVKAFITDVNRDGFHEVAEAIRAVGGKDAEDISYDNTASGLDADNVQAAIDEVAGDVGDLVTAVNGISGNVDELETDVEGKVSKSGDTMTGSLTVEGDIECDDDLYAGWVYSNAYSFKGTPSGGKVDLISRATSGNPVQIEVPQQNGTLALKSDIFPKSLIGSPWGVTRRVTFSGKAEQSRASALLIPCGSVGIGAIIPITFRTDLNGDITKVYVASNTDGVIVDPDYDNAIRIPPVYNGWADYTIIKLYNDEAYTWTVSDV